MQIVPSDADLLDTADLHKETVSSDYDFFGTSLRAPYVLPRYYFGVHPGFRRRQVVLPLTILAIAMIAAVLAWAPWHLAFLISVGLAVAWCIWLERHPAP